MKNCQKFLFMIILISTFFLSACASEGGTFENSVEESGTELALDETYNKVRNGARLVLSYDAQSNSFNGFVKNTTKKFLKQVRV